MKNSELHLEFCSERFVCLGQLCVATTEVVDLCDEVLMLGFVFLLEATRLALQFRLQLDDRTLHVLNATCVVPPDSQITFTLISLPRI